LGSGGFRGAIEFVEDGFPVELLGNLSPDAEGRAGLSAAEGDDRHRAQIARLEEIGHDLLAVFWIFRQEPQGDEVVRLPATHRLTEQKRAGGAGGFAFQPVERLRQEDAQCLPYSKHDSHLSPGR
jgi:hypothetical protein